MNEDTRVTIHCYEGDAHQMLMPAYLHHKCPITIVSPEDSQVTVDQVYHGSGDHNIDTLFAGKRGYIGQESLDRQLLQMKGLLKYPEKFFLMHDSDSVLLDPKIPDYLYADPDKVWANMVIDAIPEHQDTFPEGWPHIALQPPYFISRKTMEAMVAVGEDERCKATHMMPFIDYYMVQLTVVAGLTPERFRGCLSCPVAADPRKAATLAAIHKETYAQGYKIAMNAVLNEGASILHSVKDPDAVEAFLVARANFLAGNKDEPERTFRRPMPRVGGGRRRQPPPNSGRA